jgi:hypothetical protein
MVDPGLVHPGSVRGGWRQGGHFPWGGGIVCQLPTEGFGKETPLPAKESYAKVPRRQSEGRSFSQSSSDSEPKTHSVDTPVFTTEMVRRIQHPKRVLATPSAKFLRFIGRRQFGRHFGSNRQCGPLPPRALLPRTIAGELILRIRGSAGSHASAVETPRHGPSGRPPRRRPIEAAPFKRPGPAAAIAVPINEGSSGTNDN